MKKLKCYIIAGELSGDKLGASLIDGLIEVTNKNVSFSGVGGPLMESAGFNSLFKMSDLSLMGLIEIIPKIPMLISRIKLTANSIFSLFFLFSKVRVSFHANFAYIHAFHFFLRRDSNPNY